MSKVNKKKSTRAVLNEFKSNNNKKFEDKQLRWEDLRRNISTILEASGKINDEVEAMVNNNELKAIRESGEKAELVKQIDTIASHFRRDLSNLIEGAGEIADRLGDREGVVSIEDTELFGSMFSDLATLDTNFVVITQPAVASIILLLSSIKDDTMTEEEVEDVIKETEYKGVEDSDLKEVLDAVNELKAEEGEGNVRVQ